MEIGTNESFIPLYGDYYRFFISDGDVPLPKWWNNGGNGSGLLEGWQMYVGRFFPEKVPANASILLGFRRNPARIL